jgi:hypothetical protein
VDADAEVERRHRGKPPGRDDERRHGQRLGVDAERDLGHRDVPAHHHLIDGLGVDARLGAHLAGQQVERLLGAGLERLERVGVEHGCRYPRDHVRAERLLTVQHRPHGQRLAGVQIQQRRDDRRRPEIEGDRVPPLGGVARLHVDHELVTHDDRDVEARPPEGAADRPRHGRVELERDVVDRGRDPLEIGGLVLERRLGQNHVTLLHGRSQDDVAADPDQRRLRPRLERRDVDLEVAGRHRPAGEPPAVAQLVRAERTRVDGVDRDVTGGHAHLALATRAMPAARRVDRDAVPRCGVEHGRPCGDAHLAALGAEAQADAPGPRLDGGVGHPCAAACFARCAAIQRPPHSSWPSRKSAARTPSTQTGERASMIALVSPWLAAIARKPAPRTWRPGRPNEVFDAPQVVFTPSSSRSSRSVSMKSVTARGSAPTGIASGSITTSSGGMP